MGRTEMGHWGVHSYENDDASDAIDEGLQRVHGDRYDDLMADGNPMSFDDVQKSLANLETLEFALEYLGEPLDDNDDSGKLAFAGVVVRHAEFGVAIPEPRLTVAIAYLENETIEWDEATLRKLRRQKEIALLKTLREKLGQ